MPTLDPVLALADVLDGEGVAGLGDGLDACLPERCLVDWRAMPALDAMQASKAGGKAWAVVEGELSHGGQAVVVGECARGCCWLSRDA